MASTVSPVTLAVCWLRVFADPVVLELVCRVTGASRAVCCNISLLPGLKQRMEREASERASLWWWEGEGREGERGEGLGGRRGQRRGRRCVPCTDPDTTLPGWSPSVGPCLWQPTANPRPSGQQPRPPDLQVITMLWALWPRAQVRSAAAGPSSGEKGNLHGGPGDYLRVVLVPVGSEPPCLPGAPCG